MKRFLALCLVIVLCFTGCTMDSKGASEIVTTVQETIAETSDVTETQESETDETTGEDMSKKVVLNFLEERFVSMSTPSSLRFDISL